MYGYLQVCMTIMFLINFLLERVNIFENGNISEMWFKLNIPSSGWCLCSSQKITTKATAWAHGFQLSNISGWAQSPAKPSPGLSTWLQAGPCTSRDGDIHTSVIEGQPLCMLSQRLNYITRSNVSGYFNIQK
jgi:hypothetical protein